MDEKWLELIQIVLVNCMEENERNCLNPKAINLLQNYVREVPEQDIMDNEEEYFSSEDTANEEAPDVPQEVTVEHAA